MTQPKIIKVSKFEKTIIFEVLHSDENILNYSFEIESFTEKELYYGINKAEEHITKSININTTYEKIKTKYENTEVKPNATN